MFRPGILVNALYNCYDYCYQNGLRKARKEVEEERQGKKAITIERKEIVEQYEWHSHD